MNTKNLKELLLKLIDEDQEFDVYELSHAKGWPDIQCDFTEDDGSYFETLDMGNWQITEITDDTLTIMAGGDWQEPLAVTLKFNEALAEYNQLEVISAVPCDFGDAEEINIYKYLGIDEN